MALVIDGSSPVAHQASAQTNTSAAFSPPDDPLLVALWAGDSATGVVPSTPTLAASPAQTWTADAWDKLDSGTPGAVDGQAMFAHAVVVGSPGSTTVSITNGAASAFSSILKVLVMLGHDPAGPVGVTGGGRQLGGSSISVSFIASITGGQGFMAVSDWNAGATSGWAADTDCSIVDKGTLAGSISYAVLQRTDPDEVVGVSTSLGLVGLPPGGIYHWAYAEVISLEAAIAAAGEAGYAAFGANAPMF